MFNYVINYFLPFSFAFFHVIPVTSQFNICEHYYFEKGDVNDHLTSNGGLVQNIMISDDDNLQLNAKYTHHSCALDPDDRSYDALGAEISYRFWWFK